MDDEYTDILGGGPLRTAPGVFERWFLLPFLLKGVLGLGFLSIAYFGTIFVWNNFQSWQEANYRKAMRRRHGIPDDDLRPFNVAYAAVTRSRQDRDAQQRKPLGNDQQSRNATPEGQSARSRFNDATRELTNVPTWATGISTLPGGLPSRHQSLAADYLAGPSRSHTLIQHDPLNFTDRYNPNPIIRITEPSGNFVEEQPIRTQYRAGSRKALNLNPIEDRRKRSLELEDAEYDGYKKTRVEGDELIDGGEDAGWQRPGERRGSLAPNGKSNRGSKRNMGDEDDERSRDKRARNLSEDRDQVMGDELDSSRGKKRDRGDAESTVGGDDAHSGLEDEGDGVKSARRRKRRTMANGDSGKGKKRDRDGEEGWHDDEEDGLPRRQSGKRKKGGKKEKGSNGEDGASDISMDGSMVSRASIVSMSPSAKGRKVGDVWEGNGETYKIGPDGRRLRLTLVKKARSKFNMPEDSQHPDRSANFEVFVELWMTDEEYKEAKDRQELAWQDSRHSMVLADLDTPGNVQDPPLQTKPSGKNLLWSSTIPNKDVPSKRGPFRQSSSTNVGFRINPFQPPVGPTSRRVTSSFSSSRENSPTTRLGSPGPGLSASGFKSISKWEKQDLEAESMKRMRLKSLLKKEVSGLTASATLPSIGAPPSAVANFASLGPASFGVKEEKPAATLSGEKKTPASFGVPPIITSSTPATTAKPAEAEKSAPAPAAPSTAPPKPTEFSFPTTLGAAPPTANAPSTLGADKAKNAPAAVPAPAAQSTFAFPTSAPTSRPAQPSSNLFKVPLPTAPATNMFGPSATAPAKPSLGDAPPLGSAPPPSSSPAPIPAPPSAPAPAVNPTNNTFNFAPARHPPTRSAPANPFGVQMETKPLAPSGFSNMQNGMSTTSGTSAPSLLERMGGPAPAQQNPPAPTASNPFSFTKTESQPSAFPQPPSAPAPSQPIAPAATNAESAPLKFNFGFKPAPSTSAQSNPWATQTSSTSTVSAPTATPPKPSTSASMFGFNPSAASTTPKTPAPNSMFSFATSMDTPASTTTPKTPAISSTFTFGGSQETPSPAPGNTLTPTPTTAPKFSFGQASNFGTTPKSSNFGGSNAFGTTTPAGSPAMFGTGSGAGGAGAFGGAAFKTPTTTTPVGSPFGMATGGNVFGAGAASNASGKQAFAAMGSTPSSEATKSAFSAFSGPGSTAPSGPGANNEAKPFQFVGHGTTPAAPSAFVAPSQAGMNGATSTASSMFGKTVTGSTPTAFGFGNGNMSSAFGGGGQNQQ